MRIPQAERAVIAAEKLRDYLLDPEHPSGGSKAILLISLGYRREDSQRLAADLQDQHLTQDFTASVDTGYGQRYEIRAPIKTPRGRTVVFRSIWQIDTGTDAPRLITLYPD